MPISIDTIIARLGGPEEAARLVGIGTEAIRKWRQTGAVPPKHWAAIARATGLSLADLEPEADDAAAQIAAPPSLTPTNPPTTSLPQPRNHAMSQDTAPDGATAVLALADGTVLWGYGFGARTDGLETAGCAVGEICFSTGMTGYQETLTDPSFAGQIITFTFPHIGNIGTNLEDDEAVRVAARGLVVKQNLTDPANWRSAESLDGWLAARNVPGISGLDTRALTLRIRDHGPQTAVIAFPSNGQFDLAALKAQASEWPGLEGMDLAKTVTCDKAYGWSEGVWDWPHGSKPAPSKRRRVVAVDYGAKRNILRCLVTAGCDVTVVPATATAAEILSHDPQGVFLSNGPGDPAATGEYAVPAIKGVLEANKPIFGICLGHQLLGLALGAKTYKLARGHRGANQPVKDIETGKVEITSQNHGFAVDEKSLPNGVRVTHVSLFDGSNEGMASDTLPAFSVQYHPEASPGPSDSFYLFERFVALIDSHEAS